MGKDCGFVDSDASYLHEQLTDFRLVKFHQKHLLELTQQHRAVNDRDGLARAQN